MSPDADDPVRQLNELYAEEVEAALRYLHLGVTLKGLDRLVLRQPLAQMLEETLEHARLVAEKILQLGGVPRLDLRVHLPPELTSGRDAVRTALEFEIAAVDAYRDLLAAAGGNPELEEFARDQIALETRHVAELRLLVEDD